MRRSGGRERGTMRQLIGIKEEGEEYYDRKGGRAECLTMEVMQVYLTVRGREGV